MGQQVTISASQIDKQRLGYQAISLTHFIDTAEPSIAAGSKIEVGGALYEFTVDEAGTGWGGIGVSNYVYFLLTPAGAAVAWSYTTTAPTWDTQRQGWYTAGNRVFGGCYKDGAGDYTLKWLLEEKNVASIQRYGDGSVHFGGAIHADGAIDSDTTISSDGVLMGGGGVVAGMGNATLLKKIINIGNWDMDATAALNVAHGLTDSKIRSFQAYIIQDATDDYVYPIDFLSGGAVAGAMALQGDNISLWRTTSGLFDGIDFDATPFNRGWVVIEYTP
jgi:hypothetical protein